MTHPPQDGGEPDDGAGTGSSRVDPDRFPTEPAPSVRPGSTPPAYGQTPPYTPNPGYGSNPPYGSPQPGPAAPYPTSPYGQNPPYGAAPQVQPYGQPAQQYGAPQYGPPGQPFGAPPGPPPQKSRVGLIAILTGVVLVVIAAVVVLVRTQQSTVLDAASAERDVAAQFEHREGVAIDLDCPDDMEVRSDATYECTGRTADGESVTLRLTITDEKTAAYTWTEP
jgi:hypothetical protein